MKPEHLRLLTIALAFITAISLIGVYYTHQLPLYETRNNVLCTYSHEGIYDYEATLLPNIIHNKTSLMPGEGTLADYKAIRKAVPHLDRDRILSKDMEAMVDLLRSGGIIREVEKVVGRLA